MDSLVEKVSQILGEHAGLDANVLGRALIVQAVERRMKELAFEDARCYTALLEDETELRNLLELTLIGETWFFRDRNPFSFLATEAVNKNHPLHILCAPCATGEEAYSIAISLLASNVTNFHIDAMDISRLNLQIAAAGEYGSRSFREDLPEFDRFFNHSNGTNRRVNETVRSHVTFRPVNLARVGELALLGEYDYIFCRNLLIYLLPDLRRQLLEHLHRCLRPDGLLFTGHSELIAASCTQLALCEQPGVFALRKQCVPPAGGCL